MTKWLKIGAALLLLAWAPFIYAELTSSPAEKKERELPSVELNPDDRAAVPVEPSVEATPEKSAAAALAAEDEPEPEPVEEAVDPEAEAAAEAEGDTEYPPVADEALAAEPLPSEEPGTPDPGDPVPSGEQGDPDEEAEEEPVPPPVATGPTRQLEQAFDTEPRDALWAKDAELRIASAFSEAEAPEDMLERTSCRRAVCKIEVRWSRAHAAQYVGAQQSLNEQFGSESAVEPIGAIDDEGHQTVHLYVLRKGYTAADLSQ